MLLSKGYQANEIIAFKLVNGDEIVAKVVETKPDGSGWIVHKPCTVMPSQQGLGLIQTMFSADINNNVELKSEHVMMHCTVLKALEDHYLTTTTGISVGRGPIVV
jgi:hypothetical protein